jgi:hypothetical protein
MWMNRWLVLKQFAYSFSIIIAISGTASAGEAIGEAASVKNEATAAIGGQSRPLSPGDSVMTGEQIGTGVASAALLRLVDTSELGLGASSKLGLNRFVNDPTSPTRDAEMRLDQGAARFTTGKTDPATFTVHTEVATIGVNASDVMVICDGAKHCAVIVNKGTASVCPTPLARRAVDCPNGYKLDEQRNFTYIGPRGLNGGAQSVSRKVVEATVASISDGRIIDIAGIAPIDLETTGAVAQSGILGPGVNGDPVDLPMPLVTTLYAATPLAFSLAVRAFDNDNGGPVSP